MTFGRAPRFIIDLLLVHRWLRNEVEANQFAELGGKPCSFAERAAAGDGTDSPAGPIAIEASVICWRNLILVEPSSSSLFRADCFGPKVREVESMHHSLRLLIVQLRPSSVRVTETSMNTR